MSVRFLPDRAETEKKSQPDREKLADVVQLRSTLVPTPPDENVAPALPAFEKAVRLLARRPLSMGELEKALRLEHYSDDETHATLVECIDRGYVDDLALAQRLAEKADQRKKLSRSALKRELSLRLIPGDIIDAVLIESSDERELERMHEVASQRARQLKSLDRKTAERRLVSYLSRRGFGGSHLYRVVNEALDAQ